MYRRLTILVILLCGAVAASAQVREEITVQVVDVPVYVVSKGNPVRHLSKDDFELFVNGKPQAIDYFEPVDFSAPAATTVPAPVGAAPAAHTELRDRRLFLFLFDLIYNRPAALDRSRRAAVDMVNHALPGDLFAVAMVTPRQGIVFDTAFLRDRDAVRRAILQLAPSRAYDSLAISITGAEREMAAAWAPIVRGGGTGGGRGGGVMSEDNVPELLALPLPEIQARAQALAEYQVGSIGELALRLRELEGYKHVIFFSEGFRIDPNRLPEQFRMVQRMASAFQSANAILHTLDLNPMATGIDPRVMEAGIGPAQIPPSDNQSLLWISAKTGGKWMHWTNAFGPALEGLSASYGAAYRLGFKPVNGRKDHNDIEVKVKNLPPGATVSFRKGFAGSVPSKSAPDALRLADIIQNDTPQTGTPPEISVVARRIDVIVPVIQLSKQLGAVEGAKAMLYVFDASGAPVLSREKAFPIPKHAAADRIIQQKLDLAPGKYVAKVLLRIGDSLAFARQPFEIAPEEQPSH